MMHSVTRSYKQQCAGDSALDIYFMEKLLGHKL